MKMKILISLMTMCICSVHFVNAQAVISIVNDEFDLNEMTVNTNSIIFEIKDFKQYFSEPEGEYLFFLHCGDGRYEELSDTSSVVNIPHIYGINWQNYPAEYGNIYVEITKLYSENDPPLRFYFNDTTPGSGNKLKIHCNPDYANCVQSLPFLVQKEVSISANRDIVPGHDITFIIGYQVRCANNQGEIVFEFDSSAFKINSYSLDEFATEDRGQSIDRSRIIWDAHQLKENSEFRGFLFVRATADTNLTELLNNTLLITATIEGETCEQTTDILADAEVKRSHDPNDLDSEFDFSCLDIDQPVVKYIIQFQNTGEGPAYEVVIKDIIPEVYNIDSIKMISPPWIIGSDTLKYEVNGREVIWRLDSLFLNKGLGKLMGTGETGYGVSIPNELTKDKLIFTIPYLEGFQPKQCEAIINQAEIIFDCNESYFTNPHIFDFGCDNVGDSCQVCDKTFVKLPPVIRPENNKGFLMNELFPILNSIIDSNKEETEYHFRWYPPVYIDRTDILIPVISAIKNIDYHLVISKKSLTECSKQIITFPIRVECNLQIESNIECNFSGEKWLEATVTGDTYLDNIIWQDCSRGASFIKEFTDYSQDSVLLSVVDPITNCHSSIKMSLDCSEAGIIDWIVEYKYLLAILTFVMALWIFINMKKK